GTVTDPVTNTGSAIIAPFDGRLLGMAENQVVHTGFAAYHVGVEKAPEQVQEEAARQEAEQQESTQPAQDDRGTAEDIAPENKTQDHTNEEEPPADVDTAPSTDG